MSGILSDLAGLSPLAGYGGGSAWANTRQKASFRGVPFVVLENQMRRGRQVALHVYPYRDDQWPEDLGRSPRVTAFRGFVVGDDCDAKMRALMAAVEKAGPGQLVHPTLGAYSAQVLTFSCADQPERGRVWTFEMTVVPYAPRTYPVAVADTQAQSKGLLGRVGAALKADFAAVSGAVNQVRGAVTGVVSTVQSYVSQATGILHDATALAHLPAALAGNFGRFSGGSAAGGVGGAVNSFAQASGAVSGAVNSVGRISGSLGTLASRL